MESEKLEGVAASLILAEIDNGKSYLQEHSTDMRSLVTRIILCLLLLSMTTLNAQNLISPAESIMVTCPADTVISCSADVPSPDISLITVDDSCVPVSVTHISDVSDHFTCPESIVRTYGVTDACGDTGSCTQTITILDNTAPVFVPAPADITVHCIGDMPAMTVLQWTDNCDGQGSVSGVDVGEGTCPEEIFRTWSYTDACGNLATTVQTIVIDSHCTRESIEAAICDGETVIIHGQVYDMPGTYVDTIFGGAVNGCDSILTITIYELPNATSTINHSICPGSSVDINGQAYNMAGAYSDTIFGGATNGCDLVLTVNIAVHPDTPPVMSSAAEITPDPGFGGGSVVLGMFTGEFGPYEFLWSNGEHGTTAINNLLSGNYSVTVTDTLGCDSVYRFYVPLEIPDLPDLPQEERIPAFPNPFHSTVFLDLSQLTFDRAQVVIEDLHGDEIVHRVVSHAGLHSFLIDAPRGIYLAFVVEDGRLLGLERLVKVK